MKTVETNDKLKKLIMEFIVNNMGINLCSVDDIVIDYETDGQVRNINISFIPK